MEEWQKRELHHNTIREILKSNGCINSKGQWQSWNGSVVLPLMKSAGHSCTEYESCMCSKKEGGK